MVSVDILKEKSDSIATRGYSDAMCCWTEGNRVRWCTLIGMLTKGLGISTLIHTYNLFNMRVPVTSHNDQACTMNLQGYPLLECQWHEYGDR